MTNFTLRNSTETEFFQRGKVLARFADAGKPLFEYRANSFEYPAHLSCNSKVVSVDTDLTTLVVSCETNRNVTES
ncbi:MAG: hypothetical protein COW02_12055 [Comamonadaceae bacterium CG12_big_fil_rev_8_21_14_0_65_59_15]|nr:MAG: hypothetical protein COW02_12055 [Comamonadaceae bacterium CG12_big_fil_rev_8_21_14_0_65_59_15]